MKKNIDKINMEKCVVCLSSNTSISRINLHSSKGYECNIERIIEKHLWWWYLKQSAQDKMPWICLECWQELLTFHNFYLKVENVHKQYDFFKLPAFENCAPKNQLNTGNEKLSLVKEYEVSAEFPKECLYSGYSETFNTLQNEDDKSFLVNCDSKSSHSFQIDAIDTVSNNNGQCATQTKTRKWKYKMPNKCTEKYPQIHKETTMAVEKMFCCKECGKSFLRKSNYDCHILTHIPDEEKKYQCDVCDKKFAAFNLLKYHQVYIHLKKYVKICEICGKSCRDNSYFLRHMNEHKGVPVAKWPCDVCGVEVSSKYELNRHKKEMHTEENLKEHKCPYCPKILANKNSHKQHVHYAHKSERKHACRLCEKKFRRPRELREHLSTHTGEPLYTCAHCQKTFISNANMHKHRKSSHPKEFEEGRLKRLTSKHLKCIQNNES